MADADAAEEQVPQPAQIMQVPQPEEIMLNPALLHTTENPFVPMPKVATINVPVGSKIISLAELAMMDDTESTEDLILVLVFLGIKHSNDASDTFGVRGVNTGGNFGSRSLFSAPKRARREVSYKRMYKFGCPLSSSGICCVVFEIDGKDERKYWRTVQDRATVTVGDMIAIVEPDHIQQEVAGHLYKIQTDHPFVPLQRPRFSNSLNSSPNQEATTCFFLSGVQIKVSRCILVDSVCGGEFCDRQTPRGGSRCGCYNTDATTTSESFVFKLDLSFAFNGNTEVSEYHSWKFTKLVFGGRVIGSINKVRLIQNKRVINAAYKRIVHEVNLGGGWNIIGWFKPSTQQDGTDRYQSEGRKLHVVSLDPFNVELLQAAEIKTCMLSPADYAA